MSQPPGRRSLRLPVRRCAALSVCLLCIACTLPAQLGWLLLPEDTVPTFLANLRGVDAPVQEDLARRERAGDWPGILALADAGLATDPDQFEWLTIRAHALERLARWPDAVTAFQRVLAREPHEIDTWLHLAHAERMAGRRPDALRTLERALAVSRESPAVFAALGDLYLEAGDRVRARDAFRAALRLEPAFAAARQGLVRTEQVRD